MKLWKAKGPRVLYQLTDAETAELRALANVINGLQGMIQERLKMIAAREQFSPQDRPQFDGQKMAFVVPPEPAPAPGTPERP